ncbi:hypothetical protein U9M48_004492 [Paspalum notatum var. saurae]|uniref:Reverse transcriptase zinc-binding domain-containing protein n=1 Tax=Paspalum notatum var. saurae TaxID=547442 RepID=A0AAQ3PV79_PASNO
MPAKREISMLTRILDLFSEATGLTTNFNKSTTVLICCTGINLADVLSGLPVRRASFPLKYPGLLLSLTRLKRVDFQPLIDKISAMLSRWKGKILSAAGRLALVKSVLTSQVIYVVLALNPPKEVLKSIDSKRKHFLWPGLERVTGKKVNWTCTARPKALGGGGGLGVLHLGKFSHALRLRWLWQASKEPERKWVVGDPPCTATDKHLSTAATSVTVGEGKTASFWESAWLRWLRLRDIYPKVFSISKRKNRSMKEALSNSTWIQDLNFHNEELSAEHLQEYFQDRVWTADRLARRRWPHNPCCVLCGMAAETGLHLFAECPFSRRIWYELSRRTSVAEVHHSAWQPSDSVHLWWSGLAAALARDKRGLRSLMILVAWTIWCKRNSRIFNRKVATVSQVLAKIKDEARLWTLGGAKHLANFFVVLKVNSNIGRYLQTKKGLRQGESLSPILFNLVADMLAVFRGLITHLVEDGLSILQYADDTINFHKSELFCYGEAKPHFNQYSQIFGCSMGFTPFHWKEVEDHFQIKLSSWKGKFLSYGGRMGTLCLPKDQGGLGIMNLEIQNKCLLRVTLTKGNLQNENGECVS